MIRLAFGYPCGNSAYTDFRNQLDTYISFRVSIFKVMY